MYFSEYMYLRKEILACCEGDASWAAQAVRVL